MSVLIVQPASQERFEFDLGTEPVRIGRSQRNEICLSSDSAVSRFHAEITFSDGTWHVNDLGSHNGTFVDGQPVDRLTPLRPGSRIQIGKAVIVISDGKSEPPPPEEPRLAPSLEGQSVVLSVADVVGDATIAGYRTGVAGPDVDSPRARAFTALSRHASDLMSTPDLPGVLRLVLEMVFQAVAPERGALLLLEGDPPALRIGASRGMQSSEGEKSLISQTVADMVVNKRQSVLTSDAQIDPRFMEAHSIGLQSVHSVMSVPLWNNKDVIGIIYADTTSRPVSFSKVDLEVLTLLAHLAAIKIDQVRLFERDQKMRELERELQAAAQIQRRLLPESPPEVAGYRLHGENEPCHEVGGDYFDHQTRKNGRLAVAMGDVSGKGMGAALLMATLQAAFRAHAATDAPAAELVAALNRAVCANADPDKFITFFYCELDPGTHLLRFINAGHNPPMLFRAGSDEIENLKTRGLLLGYTPEIEYACLETTLEPGDTLVMYTDGVTEAQDSDGEEYGEQRLIDAVRDLRDRDVAAIVSGVRESVYAFTGDAGQFDDITLCVLRRI
jgi:serine phosphatase RsbU (regulator of sigma subunit)